MTKPGILGNRGEKLALKFLKKNTLRLQEKNYHCRYGEIDLVMWDKQCLVFVEVRYRKNDQFGGALESIDQHKQQKLRRSAQNYLIKLKNSKENNEPPCRFDVVCIRGNLNKPEYQWIKNAF